MSTVAISARATFEERYRARTNGSRALYEEACRHLAGGVPGNGAFREPYPLYVREAHGKHIVDVDGNEYLDLLMGGGPHILGHSPKRIMDAVREQLDHGTSTLTAVEHNVRLAEAIKRHMPHLELLRFVATGSEAMHMTFRAARAFTGRSRIAKFEGNYHGGYDNQLISGRSSAGPAEAPEAIADSAGITDANLADVLVLPFNDADRSIEVIEHHADELAAVVLEPCANTWMGGVVAEPAFLRALRETTERLGVLLIFDEVVTGFRVALGGAAEVTGVRPDLTGLAKVIGGGFPYGAFGGRRDVMELLTPARWHEGPVDLVYHSGTFQSNLVALVAGLALIEAVEEPGFYERLNEIGDRLRAGLGERAAAHGVDVVMGGYGSIVGMHFGSGPVRNMRDVVATDRQAAGTFALGLVAHGIFLAPYHMMLGNALQTGHDIDAVLDAADDVFAVMTAHA